MFKGIGLRREKLDAWWELCDAKLNSQPPSGTVVRKTQFLPAWWELCDAKLNSQPPGKNCVMQNLIPSRLVGTVLCKT